MDRNTKIKSPKTPYAEYHNTEEWVILERLLKELEKNQDIELKTAPEYVIGYLVKKLRNKDLVEKTPKKVSSYRVSPLSMKGNR